MSWLDERHRRILTTHTGSLPRPDALSALLLAKMSISPMTRPSWRDGPPSPSLRP